MFLSERRRCPVSIGDARVQMAGLAVGGTRATLTGVYRSPLGPRSGGLDRVTEAPMPQEAACDPVGPGPRSLPAARRPRFNGGMFVGHQERLEVGFAVAQARLTNLLHGNWLLSASREAYDEGITGLTKVGPLGARPGLSRLVEVQFRGLVQRGNTAVLTLRWHATRGGGGLFPVLDGDITLSPDGEHATVLAMAGAYRPPLGALGAELDRAILHRVAAASIRSFVNRIADAIAHPAPSPEPEAAIAEWPLFHPRPAPEEP